MSKLRIGFVKILGKAISIDNVGHPGIFGDHVITKNSECENNRRLALTRIVIGPHFRNKIHPNHDQYAQVDLVGSWTNYHVWRNV